jgi:hypothetical protein
VEAHHGDRGDEGADRDALAHVKQFTAQRDADRKDMDIANKVNVSQRELELAEQADERRASSVRTKEAQCLNGS